MERVAVALVIAATTAVTAAAALAGSNTLDPRALARRASSRRRSRPLPSTGRPEARRHRGFLHGVIDSYQLLTPDLQGLRVVPARKRHLLRDLSCSSHLPVPERPRGSRGERVHAAPAGARAGAANVPRDVRDGRRRLAPHPRLRLLPRRAGRARRSCRHGCPGQSVERQPRSGPRGLRAADRRRDHATETLRAARPRADGRRPGRARRSAALA